MEKFEYPAPDRITNYEETLLKRAYGPMQGNTYRLPPQSSRIILHLVDMRSAGILKIDDKEFLAGIALTLAEALDAAEEREYQRIIREPPSTITVSGKDVLNRQEPLPNRGSK